jgi:hypothetical protein
MRPNSGEKAMKMDVRSGAAIAAAAATLLIAGAAVSAPMQFAGEAIGHCNGANACKGKGACKTASNACKGQNACKGKGFLEMTKAECDQLSGVDFSLSQGAKPKT